jgi:HK97 family phage prohead protease
MTDILVRHFALERAEVGGDDGRTLEIKAVPYGHEVLLESGELETFAPGAFQRQLSAMHRVKLTLQHPSRSPGQPLTNILVGGIKEGWETPDGLYVRARMGTSTVANDALALVNDGILDEVSVGFADLGTKRGRRNGRTTLLRQRGHMDHLALVPAGAYGQAAKVLAVRDDNGPDLAYLRAEVERLLT